MPVSEGRKKFLHAESLNRFRLLVLLVLPHLFALAHRPAVTTEGTFGALSWRRSSLTAASS
jgi:hypothetical protein